MKHLCLSTLTRVLCAPFMDNRPKWDTSLDASNKPSQLKRRSSHSRLSIKQEVWRSSEKIAFKNCNPFCYSLKYSVHRQNGEKGISCQGKPFQGDILTVGKQNSKRSGQPLLAWWFCHYKWAVRTDMRSEFYISLFVKQQRGDSNFNADGMREHGQRSSQWMASAINLLALTSFTVKLLKAGNFNFTQSVQTR